MIEMPSRRWFLRGLVAAPAVILTNHLMQIKVFAPDHLSDYLVAYKGRQTFDAAFYYCPYIPLQHADVYFDKFQLSVDFKTKYALVG